MAAILHKPEPLNGKRIGFTTTFNQPISKYREGLQRVIGKPVRLQVRQGDDVPAPLVEMMEWYQEYVKCPSTAAQRACLARYA